MREVGVHRVTHMQMKASQPVNSAFLHFPREASKTELAAFCEQVSQAAVDGLHVPTGLRRAKS